MSEKLKELIYFCDNVCWKSDKRLNRCSSAKPLRTLVGTLRISACILQKAHDNSIIKLISEESFWLLHTERPVVLGCLEEKD